MTALVRALFVLAVIGIAPVAYGDANTAKAKQLYDEGKTDYDLGHYAEALTAFEMAYRIRHDSAFLFNIGQCQRNLKRYDDAQRTFRAYLRETPELPAATREQIQQIMADMDHALAKERARPAPSPDTAAPQPTRSIDSATSPPPASVEIAAPTTRGANETELHNARTKRIAGLAIGGFGLVALGVGGLFTGLANDANRHIVTGDGWSSATEDRRNMYQSLDAASFVVGGVAVATGIVLYLVGRHEQRRRYPMERAQLQLPSLLVSTTGARGHR